MQTKFENPLKKRLLRINKNLYIHRSDPLYNQKMALYLHKSSPENHFWLGEQWEQSGNEEKALSHYQEALRGKSTISSEARRSIEPIQRRSGNRGNSDRSKNNVFIPTTIKLLLLLLITSNTILLILLYLTLQRI